MHIATDIVLLRVFSEEKDASSMQKECGGVNLETAFRSPRSVWIEMPIAK